MTTMKSHSDPYQMIADAIRAAGADIALALADPKAYLRMRASNATEAVMPDTIEDRSTPMSRPMRRDDAARYRSSPGGIPDDDMDDEIPF